MSDETKARDLHPGEVVAFLVSVALSGEQLSEADKQMAAKAINDIADLRMKAEGPPLPSYVPPPADFWEMLGTDIAEPKCQHCDGLGRDAIHSPEIPDLNGGWTKNSQYHEFTPRYTQAQAEWVALDGFYHTVIKPYYDRLEYLEARIGPGDHWMDNDGHVFCDRPKAWKSVPMKTREIVRTRRADEAKGGLSFPDAVALGYQKDQIANPPAREKKAMMPAFPDRGEGDANQ